MTLAMAGTVHAQVLQIEDDGAVRRVGGGWPEAFETAPASSVAAPLIPAPYRDAVLAAAARYDLSPALIDAVARSESGYDAMAVSPAGAIGVMQLMPATARSLGVDPADPTQNIMGGAAHLRAQLDRFDGAVDLALAAYNAGGGRVVRYGGVPPFKETRAYVATNLDRLAKAAAFSGDAP
ncbi:lytic transglycosylase domain-containing protein [Caulobacter hibisci]|uniref:lytic transglycosylase domain-containing protein n=1 Tax=Caulobacter hibisci TaxID=2035993 RepID=UPI0022B83750|nr:lytic transglycosylase domain-containing protein [Caulobacter hibisci]